MRHGGGIGDGRAGRSRTSSRLEILSVTTIITMIGSSSWCQAQPIILQKPKRADPCGLYLAESTIPGAGMGIYAGHQSFDKGELVTDSDLIIPVFELEWHNDHQPITFLWNEYVWSSTTFDGMDQEIDQDDMIHGCSPGMGAAVNCRLNMINVEDTPLTSVLGQSGVSSESPGAGAFTPYYGRQFQATQHIPPGMELYLSYGERYFSSRTAYETVPLSKSYKQADKLLKRFRSLIHHVPALQNPDTNVSEALYHLMVYDFPYKSRTLYAMPSNASIIDHVLMTGGTANTTYNESIRSLEWLEENGSCMDNIKDGVSTIPHAGRGAFANRFIPQGGLVAPMPLIHIGNRHILTIYEASLINEQGFITRDPTRPIHQQLLLNYCFGHKETTLLLCPYGLLTALINHSHDQPNAKLQWSKNLRHPEWLNQTYYIWHRTPHAGLSFDVIALRDIEEDEEILIDYGIEWETAWQEHVTNFDPPRRNYTPAFEMNQQVDLQIKTTSEVDYEAIEGIFTFCRKHMVDRALGQKDAVRWRDDVRVEVEDLEDEGCYPCRVVHRNHNDSYIAELFSRVQNDHPSGMWDINVDTVKYVLFDVPRDTFYFHDAHFLRDHHQEWSFRHDMRLPDDILPDAWRLLPSQLSSFTSSEQDEVDEEKDDQSTESHKTIDTSTARNASDSNDLQTIRGKKRAANNNDHGAARHIDL